MNFYETVTAAVRDMSENGFVSVERVAQWTERIREAAVRSMVPEWKMVETVRRTFQTTYKRMVDQGGLFKYNPGVPRFTIDKVRPALRLELERRIVASASLIKLNREKATQDTLRRFSGWATSIPAGGSDAVNKTAEKTEVRKALASLPFTERRVIIDQNHKFVAALNETIAVGGGALATVWHSHGASDRNYNYRPDHLGRQGKIYALKGNWALERGLMKAGDAGYYDDITHYGEEVYCRCFGTYLYYLTELPDEMLTEKGKAHIGRKVA